MTIAEIKQQLTILQVLNHYGIKVNKNKMLNCPFHDDKNPSMQVYPETNTVHCFSGNCEHTGKAIDQIDFIMHHEKCTKHEAIQKAKSLLGVVETVKPKENLNEIFKKLQAGMPKAPNAKAVKYLQSRELYDAKLEIGFNNGKTYSKLKNCIVFPLKDKSGNVVSLYGRSLTSGHYYLENRKGLYPSYPNQETQTIILTESVIDTATVNKYTEY